MSRVGVSRVLLAMLLLVLSACRVDVRVDLDVASDGSGMVSFEAQLDEAAQEVIGDLESQLRVSDLERAGWTITTTAGEDGTKVTATKPVVDAAQWQVVLDELAGPDVFSDVDVSIEDDRQQMSFDLDLREGWDLLADEEATAALGGEPFGAPLDSFTDGRTIDEIISLDLQVSVRNFDDGDPTVRNFSPRFDQGTELVRVLATSENSTAVLLRWISIALFSLFALATLLAITGVVLQRRADRLRPVATPAKLASRVPGVASTTPAGATIISTTSPRQDTVRLVVVEALSVLYQEPYSFEGQVLPFVRDQGGTARADTIEQGFASLLTGSMDTALFWELCGVHGDASAIDSRYIAGRTLHPGAANFLAEMQRRRIPVAATTNDAAPWSTGARERDRLSAIWPWLVSSDVRTTTSNVAMFEVLRRESSIAHAHCLYVDTDVANLDAARDLGMKTALFDTGDLDLPAVVGHPVVTHFTGLFGAEK